LFLPANPSRTDPRALDREPRAIRAELEPESEPSSHPGEADRPTLRVPTGVDASRLVLITTEPSHAFQDQRLLEILRQLTPIIAPRETDRGTLFREIIEPAFGDLRGVHRDYVEIFRQMQRRIPARREDPQYQSRVRAAAEHLRDMRMKGAPVRVELRKLAEHLQREPLSAQVRAFAAAVLDYFPDGSLREPGQHRDARWWKTASSFLLDHIDEDLLAVKDHDLVGLVHDTVVTLETGWARACDAFHALRLAPFR
jgi:hypothetical protein